MSKTVKRNIRRAAGWEGLALTVVALVCLLASSSYADAAVHEDAFCTGKTVTSSEPCNSFNPEAVHEWAFAVHARGVSAPICVYDVFNKAGKQCSKNAGEDVWITFTPTSQDTWPVIERGKDWKTGTSTKVYGWIHYQDPPPGPAPSWHCCDNLGGNIIGDPEITSWGSGRLDVFARGNNNELWHRYYASNAWSSWQSLGGALTSGPGAVSRASDRVDVVARGSNNSVVHWAWDGTGWKSDNLGGTATSDPDMASWDSSRLDVFIRGTDNALWHKYSDNAGVTWSPWESLGGNLASGPSAVSWEYGRLDVVARASDGSVAHWWWHGSGWSSDNLGGGIVGDPEISSWGPYRLDVFARGTNNELWHRYYSTYPGGWQPWESLGGLLYSSPSAVSWDGGRIDAIAKASDNSINHSWFD